MSKEKSTGFNAKVYKSGNSIVLTVPQNVVKVEELAPGDILTLSLEKVTKAEPDSSS